MKTGIIAEQILEGETGTIHYRYYLPVRTWTGMVPMLDAASGGYDRCVCSADGLA